MVLSQNQQVAIYASALAGAINSAHMTKEDPVEIALKHGDELIKRLKERSNANPNEDIPDA